MGCLFVTEIVYATELVIKVLRVVGLYRFRLTIRGLMLLLQLRLLSLTKFQLLGEAFHSFWTLPNIFL